MNNQQVKEKAIDYHNKAKSNQVIKGIKSNKIINGLQSLGQKPHLKPNKKEEGEGRIPYVVSTDRSVVLLSYGNATVIFAPVFVRKIEQLKITGETDQLLDNRRILS